MKRRDKDKRGVFPDDDFEMEKLMIMVKDAIVAGNARFGDIRDVEKTWIATEDDKARNALIIKLSPMTVWFRPNEE